MLGKSEFNNFKFILTSLINGRMINLKATKAVKIFS